MLGGVQVRYTFVYGTGLWGVAKEVVKIIVVLYSKRRLASTLIGDAAYNSPAVSVITNATRVVKSCKAIDISVGYVITGKLSTISVIFDQELKRPSVLIGIGWPKSAQSRGKKGR